MKPVYWMTSVLVAAGVSGFSVLAAHADIYSWTDENGVKYFTNYAPPKQAKILMKTPEILYDEEADNQRREMDRLEIERQELAEREADLQQQQQEAERRIAAAESRAEAALREADDLLREAEAAKNNYDRERNYAGGYYYPYYGTGSYYNGYYRKNGSIYYKNRYYKYRHGRRFGKHQFRGRFGKHQFRGRFGKQRFSRHRSAFRGRGHSQRSRIGVFRGHRGRF